MAGSARFTGRPKRLLHSPKALMLLVALLLLGTATQTAAQTIIETATRTLSSAATGSGSLNAPSRTEGSGATTSRLTTQVTQTTIPDFDFSGPNVPFLFQRPIPSEFDEYRRKSAQPRMKDVYFTGCEDSAEAVDPGLRLNISAVYAQYDPDRSGNNALANQNEITSGVLRITAVGAIDGVAGTADGQSSRVPLSTMTVQSEFLTFQIFNNNSYLCDHLYPSRPDPDNQLIVPPGCLYGPGQVSFGVGIPLNDTYTLGTIWTRIRLTDTSDPPRDVTCIEVRVNPYDENKWYWDLILWFPLALTIGYFVIISLAKMLTAMTSRAKAFRHKAREGSQPNVIKDTIAPTLVASLSGQQMILSSPLTRFATPGCWDIIMHTQFVAALAMIAVRWPEFSYPFFKQAAWSTLVGNTTLIRPHYLNRHFDPHATNASLPAGELAGRITDPASPLYMNQAAPNSLLNLNGSFAGMDAFAQVVGLRARDLFGTCVSIWLIMAAVLVAISAVVWIIDSIHDTMRRIQKRKEDGGGIGLTLGDATEKDAADPDDDGGAGSSSSRRGGYKFLGRPATRTFGSSNNTIHLQLLHGNLTRLVALFHLPITAFTTFQMANSGQYSVTSIALAGLSFAFLSILIPVYLIFRIYSTKTSKLYESIGTLSALGPLYNTYSPGSQLFCAVDLFHSFVLGVVIGGGQKNGSVQAIIILVFEVLFALAASLWLPWGDGAMMGPISFVASVLRIITAVLVVLLTPLVDFSREVSGWITYVILLIQAILYVGAALLLVFKIIEGLVRLIGRASFDERASPRLSGLGGAIRKIRHRRQTLQLGTSDRARKQLASSNSTTTQTMMLPGAAKLGSGGAGMSRPGSPPHMAGSLPSSTSRARMHSRQASYASYLDNQLYGRKSPADYLNDANSPYSTYLRGDANDEGFIMAALPPTVASGPPTPAWGTAGLKRAASPPPSTGFVRMGGGRATDAAPYETLQAASDGVAAQSSDIGAGATRRSQSQSGIMENPRDRRTSHPAFNSSHGNEMTSTHAAAQHSASYTSGTQLSNATSIVGLGGMAVQEGNPSRKKKKGLFRRGAKSDLDDSSDDDDYDDSRFKSQGGWRGISKMSAAFGALTGRLGGGQSGDDKNAAFGDSLEPASEETGQSKGFEVVRAPRPRKSMAGAEQPLDSTAEAAAAAASGPGGPSQSQSQAQLESALNQAPPFETMLAPGRPRGEDTYDPSSGTLPPGASEQALLLPHHAPNIQHLQAQREQHQDVNRLTSPSRGPSESGEDTFWVAPESTPSLRPSTGDRQARQELSGSSSHQTLSVSGRLAQPMSAEVFNSVDDLSPSTGTTGDNESKRLSNQWFDADGNLNTEAINFDSTPGQSRPQSSQQSQSHQQPQPAAPVWDAAQAYGMGSGGR